jgi:hypothetical protein
MTGEANRCANRWPGGNDLLFDLRLSGSNRRFEFHKRGQLFIRTHNKPLPVVAMRVNNPDCSPLAIQS